MIQPNKTLQRTPSRQASDLLRTIGSRSTFLTLSLDGSSVAELGVRSIKLIAFSRVFLAGIISFLITGCSIWPWEPYPNWEQEIVQKEDVPKQVIWAFKRENPNSFPIQIEKSVFLSRIQNYPTLYKFWISESEFVIYDNRGNLSELNSWFSESKMKTEQGAAANP